MPDMNAWLRWTETSAFSTWLRESTSVFAYPAILSAHAIGMGLAVGVSFALAVRVLGVARGIPVAELRRLAPLLWGGFVLNAASGVLLLIAYPTKALSNPVFSVKLAAIAAGIWTYAILDRRTGRPASAQGDETAGGEAADRVWRSRLRLVAVASLVSWAAAITAGRLLAYTYHRLFVDF